MELKGSRTEANLYSAFAGESQAMVKYRIFSEKAKQEGYEGIAEIFQETSQNEQAHAAIWLRYIHGGNLKDTASNLSDAQQGEHFEWTSMYADYAKIAKEEGFDEIARRFEMAGNIEKRHDGRYQKYLDEVNQKSVFKKQQAVQWICTNCGFVYAGESAPQTCPVCSYPQAYFKPMGN